MLKKCNNSDIVKSIAERVVKEGDRIARIVESLLSFTHREKQSRRSISINRLFEDTMSLMGAQMRKDAITVQMNIPEDFPPVVVVPQEIQQVFLNILNNAQYSLNSKYPGIHQSKIIEISACSVNSNDESQVRISFHDNGEGISQRNIDKVMNPFFSTKPMGKGTGLGLSISQGIISDHGGALTIRSVEGQYTEVVLTLPVAEFNSAKESHERKTAHY